MKIYTKSGDGGQTGLYSGQRVRKSDPRIEAIGAVDELNSLLGLAHSVAQHAEIRETLHRLQEELFDVGAGLATLPDAPKQPNTVDDPLISEMETHIDDCGERLPRLKNFILPGGGTCGATLHVARTVCRRAERRVEVIPDFSNDSCLALTLKYLNRLGDFLFVLARLANLLDGEPEQIWQPK